MDKRLWTFEDIKDATARHEDLRNTDNPMRYYLYGIALEMAGQAEEADEKYVAFRLDVRRVHGDLEAGAEHYEREARAFSGDARRVEYYNHMVKILRGEDPFNEVQKRRASCLVM